MIRSRFDQHDHIRSFPDRKPGRTRRAAAAMLACAIACACAHGPRETPAGFRMALFGSTCPESPFKGNNPLLGNLTAEINRENPHFAVHMGDIVFGGHDWMGIRESDLVRQLRDYREQTSCLRPPVFHVKGEMDMLAGKDSLYRTFTGRPPYYSFNYGNVHCVILDTSGGGPGKIGERQMRWLKDDLMRHGRRAAILVFAHHPLFAPDDGELSEGDRCADAQSLHALFRQFPVTAVFSGHLKKHSQSSRDGILYVIAGSEFTSSAPRWGKVERKFTWHMVDFSGAQPVITRKQVENIR